MSSKRITMVFGILFVMGTGWFVAASATDACSLLTEARVSAVLGVSVGAGQHIAANNSPHLLRRSGSRTGPVVRNGRVEAESSERRWIRPHKGSAEPIVANEEHASP